MTTLTTSAIVLLLFHYDPLAPETQPAPMPSPHHCPGVARTSPLRHLQTKELMWGCPTDVHIRPGRYRRYEIAFTCSSSPSPLVIVRSRGRVPFPKPFASVEAEAEAIWEVIRASGGYGIYFGPEANRPSPPPCATHTKGMMIQTADYREVDRIVKGLVRWIVHNNLDTEMVIEFVRAEGSKRHAEACRAREDMAKFAGPIHRGQCSRRTTSKRRPKARERSALWGQDVVGSNPAAPTSSSSSDDSVFPIRGRGPGAAL